MDQKARMKNRKDCDEVFPGIIVGNGECIKDVRWWWCFLICFLSTEISHTCLSIFDIKLRMKNPSFQLEYMLDLGVTHIINCAEQVPGQVDDDDDVDG